MVTNNKACSYCLFEEVGLQGIGKKFSISGFLFGFGDFIFQTSVRLNKKIQRKRQEIKVRG